MKKRFRGLTLVIAGLLASFGFGACKGGAETVTVYMPDGAPALAFAKMMSVGREDVEFRVVNASVIATKVTNTDMDKNADFCVMPVTAAAKVLGQKDDYRMLGLVTHGNLYMISKDTTSYTKDNLSSLLGKTVGVLQINSVPGLTFKTVLNRNGVAWQELKNDVAVSEEKVNLRAVTDANSIGTMTDVDCFVLAEPAVTVQVAKNGFTIVGDLQALYAQEGQQSGYPQAALVAKKEFVEDKKDWTESFLKAAAVSMTEVVTMSGEQIVAAVTANLEDTGYETTLKAPFLTATTLSRCGIRFSQAADCKFEVHSFLTEMIEVQADSTKLPNVSFYDSTDWGL
ncbi:MAG: ABC transporter substrate-binding protein [Clostridia bacterium]|nr:ABC transporter substrate-binding protein [Clostridia bacterium]